MSLAPEGVKVKVSPFHGGQPYVCPTDHPGYLAAEKALKVVYGIDALPVRSGGSIPIVALFEAELGVKSILLGFGLDSDAIHSPNEHYGLRNFYDGIRTIPLFYQFYAEGAKS
jgi:acetylornithine deacetylase/succinyl-diaminopimelate desuccinylase-like protein